MRSLARWGTLPLAAWPLGSWALGLGDIETLSYLNQPLNAEITLSATPEELAGLNVSMAPVTAFTSRGLEYPALLNSIEFSVGRDASGQNVIRLRSREVISEPFVTMVVSVSSGRSAFTREYSVLLDPPLFLPAGAAPEPIAAPATRAPEPDVTGGNIQRPAQAAAPAPRPAQQPAAAPAPAPTRAAPQATDGQYTVQSGDTLWRIAQGNRPAGVSTNQAMIAIYEANPDAFDGNINLLRRGAILRIPPVADFSSVASAAATAEVTRQMDAWRAGVEAAPRVVLLPPSPDDVATGAALGGADSGAVSALENEVSDLQSELASTREQLAEAQRLLELRSSELADLQTIAGDEPAAVEAEPVADAAADAADAADAVTAEEPIFVDDEPAATVEPVAEEAAPAARPSVPAASTATADTGPSLVDTILATIMKPVVLIGAGIGILLIGALAFLRRRRGDEEDVTGQWEALEAEIEEEADHAATTRLRARAAEPDMVVVEGHDGDATAEEPKLGGTAEIEALVSDTGRFGDLDDGTTEIDALTMPDDDEPVAYVEPRPSKADQTLSSQTVINLDQADPIAEADFHMAYGLYDQAADLIAKALEADPTNLAYKLKLLEVFFVWGNKEQFLESAQALRGEIGQPGNADWDKVVIMGKQICPDEPLFSEATAAAGEIDLDLDSSGEAAGLDFAFEDEASDDVDLDFGMDDDDDGGLSLAASGQHAAPKNRDDDDMLDIGERTQAGLEAALFEEVDSEAERTTPGGDSELSDLDSTMESPTVETPYGGNDFDALTLESPTVETEGPDAPTVETPTIESPAARDVGDTIEQQGPGSTVEMTAEIELDDLGLDIGDLEDLSGGDDDDSLSLSLSGAEDLTVEQPGRDDDELLSATGVTQVLHQEDDDELAHTGTAVLGDEDATMMAPGFDTEATGRYEADATGIRTAVLEQSVGTFDPDEPQTEDDLDLNLDDFSSALEGGAETVEQPMASGFGNVDLDVGLDLDIDDDAPTGTEAMGTLDPQTMTEVGTKLDLARAYIDMGDPDGAKSILEEVLNEGDSGQRSEAQALIDALPA